MRTPDPTGQNGKFSTMVEQKWGVIFDDSSEVLQECFMGGARIYPITTSREKHEWNEKNTPAGKHYAYRFLSNAVEQFLKDEKERGTA